jgi:6-pyruvoyltetrahydropterin/6-carboxytetrahydropterin synthase
VNIRVGSSGFAAIGSLCLNKELDKFTSSFYTHLRFKMGIKKSVYKTFVDTSFSAAHQLEGYKGACGDLHGHTWRVRVEIETDSLDKIGMTLDFKDLKTKVDSVIKKFDHCCLNQISPFDRENPTAENIARHIYIEMKEILPDNINVSEVIVWESANYGVKYSER